MSPRAISVSVPCVDDGAGIHLEATWNAMAGRQVALITPGMTFTDGRLAPSR